MNTSMNENEVDMIENKKDTGQLLAQKFNQFMRKSTESIIEMGKIIVKVRDLNNEEQDDFYSSIRFKKTSKAIFKLAKIGNSAPLLTTYIDDLPSNWTTLYTLTQLDDKNFVASVEAGKITHALTGAEAEILVNSFKTEPTVSTIQNSKNKPKILETQIADHDFCLAIKFDSSPSFDEVNELKNLLESFREKAKCSLLMSKVIESLLDNMSVQSGLHYAD